MAMQLAGRRVALAVGIIILAVGTVAAISFVKNRGESVRHNEISKVADEKLKQMEGESGVEGGASGGGEVSGSSDGKASDASNGPGSSTGSSAGQEPSAKQDPSTESNLPAGGVNPGTEVSEMPQTGAEVFAALPLAILVFVTVSYLQSRRSVV